MSYQDYFELREQPFAITRILDFSMRTDSIRMPLIRIHHAIDSSIGLTLVIGDMGLGKTFLSRKINERLQAESNKYETSLLIIIHHEVSSTWLLKKIAIQLGVEFPAEENSIIIAQICKQLLAINESGKKAVVMIDEAHMLQEKSIYEEIRGLLNLEVQSHKLLNIILFGPPELEKFIQLDPPLVSRIGMKIKLEPMDEKNTCFYINHRLEVAGATKEIFTRDACESIWNATKGVPRLVNTLSDNALLEAYLEKKQIITPYIVEKVAESLAIGRPPSPPGDAQKKKKMRDWYYT